MTFCSGVFNFLHQVVQEVDEDAHCRNCSRPPPPKYWRLWEWKKDCDKWLLAALCRQEGRHSSSQTRNCFAFAEALQDSDDFIDEGCVNMYVVMEDLTIGVCCPQSKVRAFVYLCEREIEIERACFWLQQGIDNEKQILVTFVDKSWFFFSLKRLSNNNN